MKFCLIFFTIVFALPLHASLSKGTIRFLKGRAFVIRGGIQTLPAKVGLVINAGDLLTVDEGSYVSLELSNTGLIKIGEKTKFEIPVEEEAKQTTSKISLFFGGLWIKARKLLENESFEVKTPTATAGVRGTEFDVSFDSQSQTMETAVIEGEVYNMSLDGQVFQLTAGMVSVASGTGGGDSNVEVKKDPVKVAQKAIKAAEIADDESQAAKARVAKQREAAQKRLEKAQKEAEAMQKRKELEAKQKEAAAKKKALEEAAKAKKKAEEEAAKKRKEVEEARKKKEELKRKLEEQKKLEEQNKKKEAEKRKAEEKAAKEKASREAAEKKAKDEANKKATEEKQKKAEAEQRAKAQALALKQAEEAAKKRAEAESRAKAAADEEAKVKAEAEAKKLKLQEEKARETARTEAAAKIKAEQEATAAKEAALEAQAKAKAEAQAAAKAAAEVQAAKEAIAEAKEADKTIQNIEKELLKIQSQEQQAKIQAENAQAELVQVSKESQQLEQASQQSQLEVEQVEQETLKVEQEIQVADQELQELNQEVDSGRQTEISAFSAPQTLSDQSTEEQKTADQSDSQNLETKSSEDVSEPTDSGNESSPDGPAEVIENLINDPNSQAAAEEERRQQAIDAELARAAENARRLEDIITGFEDKKSRLQEIHNRLASLIQDIANRTNLTDEEKDSKRDEISRLKSEASEIHADALKEESSLGTLNATMDQQAGASEQILLISDLYNLVNGLSEDQLVPIEIDFSSFFGSVQKISATQKLQLPVRFKNYNLKIEIQAQDLKDHRKVMEIIEKELEIQLHNDYSAQQEALRLEELRKLQQERLRERRESDTNPATATRDGQGTLLPIIIK